MESEAGSPSNRLSNNTAQESSPAPQQKKWLKRLKLALCIIAAIIIIGFGAFFIYASDYYHDKDVSGQNLISTEQVQVQQESDYLAFGDPSSERALIFYPGAKVEFSAYSPLMRQLAEEGYLCIIVRMPFNFAFFDVGAATRIIAQFPDVSHWWIGGHSLGGSMAASHAARNASDFEGVLLLGSYSADDLSSTQLVVCSIYGSNDEVLNHDRLIESRALLPSGFIEHVIEGGNHAYFGNYGQQDGDGIATITPEEQWAETTLVTSQAMSSP